MAIEVSVLELNIILRLINENKLKEARGELIKLNVVDIAQLLDELDNPTLAKVFRLLPKELSTEVFAYLSPDGQQNIINSITDTEIGYIIEELFLDDAIDFLEEMPATVVKRVLANTKDATRTLINQFLRYPPDSAGSIMTIEYVDLKRYMTVTDAIGRIRNTGFDKETIDTCYVTSSDRILEGTISLRKLILSAPDVVISDIMEENVMCVNTHDDQEQIALTFKKYSLYNMPVVDHEGRLVGIITIDDVVEVIEQENTEDFQKMAAMTPSDDEYMETPVLILAKNRILWLLVLMLSATFTGNIILRYDISNVLLSSFIPMLMDTAGNAGSQSATMVIRGIALGEIAFGDIFRVQWKEFRVSVITGLALAIANFVRIMLMHGLNSVMLALTVCLSLFATIVLAKFVGGSLPIIAKKLRADPAIMASPLITTIVDALALIVFFTLAQRFLPQLI